MRQQQDALVDAKGELGDSITALQDADAPDEVIERAESLYEDVSALLEDRE